MCPVTARATARPKAAHRGGCGDDGLCAFSQSVSPAPRTSQKGNTLKKCNSTDASSGAEETRLSPNESFIEALRKGEGPHGPRTFVIGKISLDDPSIPVGYFGYRSSPEGIVPVSSLDLRDKSPGPRIVRVKVVVRGEPVSESPPPQVFKFQKVAAQE